MSEKALVTNLSVRVDDTIGPLRAAAQQAKGTDDSFAAMADSLANSVEDIAESAGNAFKRLDDGTKVSQSAWDALAQKAAVVRTAVETEFGRLADAPVEMQNAVTSAERTVSELAAAMERQRQSVAHLRDEYGKSAAELARLAEEQERAAELSSEANERFGDTAKRIAEIRSATEETFPEQRERLEELRDSIAEASEKYESLGTVAGSALEQMHAEAQRVQDALNDLSATASTDMGRIRDGFIAANRQSDALTQSIRTGNPQMREEFANLVGSLYAVRQEVERTRGSMENATAEEIASIRALEARVASAKVEIRNFGAEMRRQGADLDGASNKWLELGNNVGLIPPGISQAANAARSAVPALGSVGAAAGPIAVAIAAVAAASKAWYAAFGTDMRGVETLLDDVGRKWDDVRSRLHNFEEALWDLDPAVDNIHRMGAALQLSAKDFQALTLAEDIAGKEIENYSEKLDQLRGILDAESKAHQSGILAQRLWNDAKRDAAGDLDKVAAAGQRLTPVFEVMKKFIAEGAEGERLWSKLHIDHTTTLDQLMAQMKKAGIDVNNLKKAFDDAKEAEKGAQQAHEEYLQSLSKTEQTVNEVRKSLTSEQSALDDANRAKETAEGRVRLLAQQYEALGQAIKDEVAANGESSAKAEELLEHRKRVAAELDAQRAARDAAVAAEQEHAESVRKLTAEHKAETESLKQQGDELLALVAKLQAGVETRRVLTDEERDAIKRIQELREETLGLDAETEALIERYAELALGTAEITSASGKATQQSLLEQENVREELKLLGEKIIKRREQAMADDEARDSSERLTTARRSESEATAAGEEIQIRWSDKARQGKLSADEAADTMRKLGQAHEDASTKTTATTEKAEQLAERLPAVGEKASQAATGMRETASAAGDAAPKLDQVADAILSIASTSTPVGVLGFFHSLDGALGSVLAKAAALEQQMGRTTEAIKKSGEAAAAAAGDETEFQASGAGQYTGVSESV